MKTPRHLARSTSAVAAAITTGIVALAISFVMLSDFLDSEESLPALRPAGGEIAMIIPSLLVAYMVVWAIVWLATKRQRPTA